MRQACEDTGHRHLSCALEASKRATDRGRVHLHAFMTTEDSERKERAAVVAKLVRFENMCASHISPCIPGRGAKSRIRAVNEGHYYLQAEKIGAIWNCANYRKNQHFQVHARWIMSLWRLRKLDHCDARARGNDTKPR